MNWIYLAIAIILEVFGTTCLKLSYGMTRLWPSVGVFAFYSVSFICLSLALKTISVSVAYAIWGGVGIVCITLIDLYLFHTHLGLLKILAITLILIGVVSLKLIQQ